MGSEFAFQFLLVMMYGLFAVGFVSIWRFERSMTSAGLFGSTYVFAAIGMGLDFALIEGSAALGPVWATVVFVLSTFFYLATSATYVIAVAVRFGCAVPWYILASLSLLTVASQVWFGWLEPDPTWQLISRNFGCALLFVPMLSMFKVHAKSTLDRLWFRVGVVFVPTVAFTVPLVHLVSTEVTPGIAVSASLAPYVFHLAVGALALVAASVLFVSYGADIVESLQRKGRYDGMTGVMNRTAFVEHAEKVLAERRKGAGETCLIVCDIDHFKAVNDRHGHAAGDTVITGLAALLRNSVRESDLVARIGGEEFAMLLTHCETASAVRICDLIRERFGSKQLLDEDADLRCTASFGVAVFVPGDTYHDLFMRADAGLYGAKRAGRDRTRLTLKPPALAPDAVAGDSGTKSASNEVTVL